METLHGFDKYDDLYSAIEYNPQEGFTEGDILGILAEVPGENDEYDWHWVVKLKDKRYVYVSGGCDYTGWD